MAEDTSNNSLKPEEITGEDNRSEEVITVVLTADNHLGYAAFGQNPHKREEHQQRLRHAFQQATDFAIAQGVDLFIQAGDLFDTTTPGERDRSFVAARLAQLKQAGIGTFALGGVHDTPSRVASQREDEASPAPLLSYARLGALHYFPPLQKHDLQELEPVMQTIRGVRVGICGLSMLPGQEDDLLSHLRVQSEIESAAIPILIAHAPIEDLKEELKDGLHRLSVFSYILAGYPHSYSRSRVGNIELIVAGATQHVDFSAPDHDPGFVFLGLAADGVRWCNHISVDALALRQLTIHTPELWPETAPEGSPTEIILERLRPLCNAETMIQLRLEGELTRSQYHQLDLNQIRRYGEEHCFALAIDDSALSLLAGQEAVVGEKGTRFSPREELIALADEWIAASNSTQEKKALQITKEELLLAMDEIKSKR